jgi:hypothetical protein
MRTSLWGRMPYFLPYSLLMNASRPPNWAIFLVPVGPVADAATVIVSESRAHRDPRRRKTLVGILPLNEDPEWLPASARADENQ